VDAIIETEGKGKQMPELNMKVGDVVAVHGPWHMSKRTVKKVFKRYVQLNDGSRWSYTGQPYPRESYPSVYLEAWTPDVEDNFKRLVALDKVRKIEWSAQSRSVLESVLALVDLNKAVGDNNG
jgi:hypothetical protein